MTTLAKVLAAPDDLDVRLAYAKKVGGDRGRHIELQVEAERDPKKREQLLRQAEDLQLHHEVEWLEPVLALEPMRRFSSRSMLGWRAGFLEQLLVDAHVATCFDEVCALAPIRSVHLLNDRARTPLDELTRSKHFARLRSLHLESEKHAGALAGSKHRPALTHLRIPVDAAGVAALRGWDGLSSIEHLEIIANQNDATEVGAWLAGEEKLTSLKAFAFRGPLDGKTAKHLFASDSLANLERLELRFAELKATGTKALAAASFLPNLRTLVVKASNCGKHLQTLPLRATELRRLDVSGPTSGLNAKGMAPFLESLVGLEQLRELDLGGCALRQIGTEALATQPILWKRIETLSLDTNTLKDVGAKALAEIEMPALRRLKLGGNGIGAPGLGALARSGFLAKIRSLDLDQNKCGTKGGKALAEAESLRLEELSLCYNWMGIQGLEPLLRHPDMKHLRRLFLKYNNYDEKPLHELARSETVTKLEQLFCFASDDEGFRDFFASKNCAHLREVTIGGGASPDAVTGALLDSKHLGHLSRLSAPFGHATEHLGPARRRFGLRIRQPVPGLPAVDQSVHQLPFTPRIPPAS